MPNAEEIKKELYTYTIEPYIHINREGIPCVITEQSAIQLLNRYCDNLYRSKFVVLSPTWILHKSFNQDLNNEEMYRVIKNITFTLNLPSYLSLFTECSVNLVNLKNIYFFLNYF